MIAVDRFAGIMRHAFDVRTSHVFLIGQQRLSESRLIVLDAENAFAAPLNNPADTAAAATTRALQVTVVADGHGIPLGIRLASASPAEVTLLETILDHTVVPPRDRRRKAPQPKRLIADRAYDSDAHRIRLAHRGIESIRPHRKGRRRKPTQDGRSPRRYRRRWTIERTFARFTNFRQLVVRHERGITVLRAFFHVACVLILLRRI